MVQHTHKTSIHTYEHPVVTSIYRYSKFVGLRSILKLREVKTQIEVGDLCAEVLESAWLEACAVKVR